MYVDWRFRSSAAALFALCALLIIPGHAFAVPANRLSDRGQIPAAAAYVGRVDAVEPISFNLSLPLRNEATLDGLLKRIYTPSDPMYHHYLSKSEFASRFAPTDDDYNQLIAYAQSKGLTVAQTSSNHLLLGVIGSSAAVESLFSVHMNRFTSGTRFVHAPDTAATIPDDLAALGADVIGLNNTTAPHTHIERPNVSTGSHMGSGIDGSGLAPADIHSIYGLSQTRDNGAGQTVGLVELDGYIPGDITTFASTYGLPAPNLTVVPVDGGVATPGSGSIEVELDIEITLAMAPSIGNVRVYEAPNNSLQNAVDIYNQVASEDICKSVSTSWGLDEISVGSSLRNSENAIFKEMASQGQSIFAASGDDGAYDNLTSLSVDDPGSQPYVTDAGGTTLSVTAANQYLSETAWSDLTRSREDPHGTGGGGGISVEWSIPTYQSGIMFDGSSGQYSTSFRNCPDVSLDADPNTGYSMYYTDPTDLRAGGSWITVGGTSAAAPQWSALIAMTNQQLAESSKAPVGFANPLLYQLYGNAAQYARDFHDITTGNNLYYNAVTGYDTATGLGSMTGSNLIADLSNVAGGPPSFPSIASLSPTSAAPGSPATTLTVNGANFLPDSLVEWNGTQLATAYVSGEQLTATIPASLLSTTGVATMTVSNPDGTLSGSASFTVSATQTPPAIASLNPSTAAEGSSAFTLAVTGSGFVNGSTVEWDGSLLTTTFLSTTSLTAQVSATLIASTGAQTVTVMNPNSSISNGVTFVVQAPAPTIGALSPTSATTGAASFTLTVTGTSFVTTSLIDWNGSQLSTTFVSSTKLTATVPSSLLTASGQASITIGSLTGGASSGSVLFTIEQTVPAPTISSTSPTDLTVGTSSEILKIFGSGYISSTTATLAGNLLPSTLINADEIDATVPSSLLGATTSLTLLVSTAAPGGGTVQATIPVVNPAPAIAGLDPMSANANGAAFTLTVTGSNFVSGSLVSFGATTLATTYISSTQLQVMVPAAAVATSETVSVSVTNPPPGGGTTQGVSFTIVPAVLHTFSAGLQMISAPNDFSQVSLSSAFGVPGIALANWNPLAADYTVTPTAPDNALVPGTGYWAHMTQATNLYDVGAPLSTGTFFQIVLSPGWNMIGTPYTQSTSISSLNFVDAAGNTDTFANATQLGLIDSTLFSYPAGATQYATYTSTDSIDPYVGYWIYAETALTLEITAPTVQPLQ